MFLYKAGNFFYRNRIPKVPRVFDFLIRMIHNSAVFSSTQIGKGTKFGYGGIAVVIHKNAIIGENCMIGPHVTIGGRSRHKELPIIGDNVYISTGAKVLGPIRVGSNSIIGANAVVIDDVPANSIVAGVPARVIKSGIDPHDYI